MSRSLRGRVHLPGDKSISHRAVLISSIAEGDCRIRNLAGGKDVKSTVEAARRLGVEITESAPGELEVHGIGMNNFVQTEYPLDCGNAGTALRLLLGLLAGSNVSATLDGDESLRRRPVSRVAIPLRRMGASIKLTDRGTCPVSVTGKPLVGIRYTLPVASAQVKSAIMLAALSAEGKTEVFEPAPTRDHTERLLTSLGVSVSTSNSRVSISPVKAIPPFDIDIPGDISSAAFVVTAAILLPGSEIEIENVCLNPTRCGYLQILRRMGADISTDEVEIRRGEAVGKLLVKSSALHSYSFDDIPVSTFIDEVPVLALAATQAEGVTRLSNLNELRVKESDRLAGIQSILANAGANIQVEGEDIVIHGPSKLLPPQIDTQQDHRLAMTVETINLISEGRFSESYPDEISVSFPEYHTVMKSLLD